MRRLCSNESGPDNSLPSAAARGNQCVEGEREKERERDGERCGSGLESAEMINRRWWHVFVSSGFGWICFQHTANRNKEHLHASRISGQSKPGQSVKIRKELSLQSSYCLYSRCCSANGCSIRTKVQPTPTQKLVYYHQSWAYTPEGSTFLTFENKFWLPGIINTT